MPTNDEYWLKRAQSLYSAYGEVTDFKNFQGNPMPAFEDLPETIKNAWVAAALRGQIDSANLLLKAVTDDNAESHIESR